MDLGTGRGDGKQRRRRGHRVREPVNTGTPTASHSRYAHQPTPAVDLAFLPPRYAWAIPYDPEGGPILWTEGGHDWKPITITVEAR